MVARTGNSARFMSDQAQLQYSPTLIDRIESLALALGFDRVGRAAAQSGPDTARFADWLERGFAGEMDYLGRRSAERLDPSLVMPGVRTILVVGLSYEPREGPPGPNESRQPVRGRVAAYAGGEDYHTVLIDRLRTLAEGLSALAGRRVAARCYVDTGPVQERVFAARAGIGWVGKNTLVIDPELGSRMLLGVILTDLDLEPSVPLSDHCGTCRACLDACPSEAFPEPYVLDATRCIAYTTIEKRGEIPLEQRSDQGDWVFGCDVCQDVCPWNRKRRVGDLPDPLALRERLAPRPEWAAPALAELLALDEETWSESVRGTALKRARYQGLIRNALVAAGNSRDPSLRPAVVRHASGSDALLAEHARWALAQLAGEQSASK